MDRSGRQNVGVLVYPSHQLKPEDLLYFSEMSGFIDDWKQLGLDVEFDLCALQVMIMADPKHGDVVPGTDGLRKLPFAPPKGIGGKRRGERNSCRICYVYFEEFYTVLLVTAYAKGRQGNISNEEKSSIKKILERVHASLSTRYGA